MGTLGHFHEMLPRRTHMRRQSHPPSLSVLQRMAQRRHQHRAQLLRELERRKRLILCFLAASAPPRAYSKRREYIPSDWSRLIKHTDEKEFKRSYRLTRE